MVFLNNLAIKFMSLSRLAADLDDADLNVKFGWVKDLINVINWALVPILGVCAAAGSIYAIVIAVQLARADSGEKRTEAKKRLISVIVAVVVLVVLILFFTIFFKMILNAAIPGGIGDWF